MSAYSEAHGAEAAVDLVVANDRAARETFLSILEAHCVFTEAGGWTGLDNAAEKYSAFLKASPLRSDPDLAGVDLDAVDYRDLVRSELQEINLQAGRSQLAGL